MARLFRYVGPIPLDLEKDGKKLSLMPGEMVDLTGRDDLIALARELVPTGELQDHSTPDKPRKFIAPKAEPPKDEPKAEPPRFEPGSVHPLPSDKPRRK